MLKRNRRAVSPVIGTILMVAITVVLAAVLYVMVTGLVGPPQGQKPSLVLSSGTWNTGNLTIAMVSITNAPNLNPTDLTYLIQSVDGATYFSGPQGAGSPFSNVTVTLNYLDNANIEKVSAEDTIRITVGPASSTAIRGGSFKIFYASDTIAFINQLP